MSTSLTRIVPPSGNPIYLGDLLRCLSPARDAMTRLREGIREELGAKHAFFVANGRGALSILLQVLANKREYTARNAVVVPSYTCYSVAASVLQAGLVPIVCDIDPETLSYDADELASINFESVLAVVSANLYGIPNNLRAIEELARERGVLFVDDAAQCFGGTTCGKPAGMFGDAGILSFDKGKVVTSINGGVIITNDDRIAEELAKGIDALLPLPLGRKASEAVKAIGYALFLHPTLYWLPSALPFLGLGATVYDDSFDIRAYFEGLAPIVNAQLERLQASNDFRRMCAEHYAESLQESAGVRTIDVSCNSRPIYLRFPLRIESSTKRNTILKNLSGLGVSSSYPASIADIPEIQGRIRVHNNQCSGGRTIAGQIITLPTHLYVRPQDLDRTTESIITILESSSQ